MPWVEGDALTPTNLNEKLIPVYNVAEYGAIGNGIVDDAPSIQSALNAAAAANGGTVWLPAKTFALGSGLTIGSSVRLCGSGWSSTLILNASANTSVIRLGNVNVYRMSIENLRINGSKASQSAGTWHGIEIVNAGGSFPDGDSLHRLFNVLVEDTKAAGIYSDNGNREMVAVSCYVQRAGSHGYDLSCTDSVFLACTSGAAAFQGWAINTNNCRFIGCKGFGSGQDGFNVIQSRNALVGCEGQDNTRHGFTLFSPVGISVTDLVVEGCIADSNTADGFRIDGVSNCVISGTALVRVGGTQTLSAVDIGATNYTPVNNHIRVANRNCTNLFPTGAQGNNTVEMNGVEYASYTQPSALTSAGTTNDFAVDATKTVLLSGTGSSATVSGISYGFSGRRLHAVNTSATTIVFAHNDTGSSAANRILCNTGANISLAQHGIIDLEYDSTVSMWRAR